MRSGPINLQESVVLREIVLARRSGSSFVARGSKPSAAVQDGPGQAEANDPDAPYLRTVLAYLLQQSTTPMLFAALQMDTTRADEKPFRRHSSNEVAQEGNVTIRDLSTSPQ
ncbi:uncharacterized protein RHO25_011032 [Cercospora beticola]|uniref:Uncharacterized protein n=1 Tax=Cercospora beticola TaxID=122368 RepID=A0ABZ0P452_CERBT|nr:hypothetical protein RHO25_011032 [Cercospora beticola]